MVRNLFWGALIGAVVVLAGVSLYFVAGIAPVATSSTPMPLEHFFAKAALRSRISREMPNTVPFTPNEADYLEGARIYRADCAVCHGLPGKPQSAIALGLFPEAPELFKREGVTDDPPGETYWKVVNGIRLTGMPGFRKSLSQHQAWEVTLLLARANMLSNPVRSVLTGPLEQPAPAFP
jgi:hypothetical protein